MADSETSIVEAAPRLSRVGGPYAWYVLIVLVIVYAFNFIDRSIIVTLAPYLKADLGLTDAQLGLLFGTAFAVFYALLGIPLAGLADSWVRTRTMALGLALWSGMTALSGFSGSFVQLSMARLGVGVGEASASPAAYSLLSDWFPREKRGTALAIYSSGIYIGSGLSLVLGALIVSWWTTAYPAAPPFGLKGWQVAFLAVGLPGLLLAALVATMKEPDRGAADGIVQPRHPAPFAKFWMEMTSVIPPLTLLHLAKLQAPAREWRRNIGTAALLTGLAVAAIWVTDGLLSADKRKPLGIIGGIDVTSNTVQWLAVALAFYGALSWAQSLRLRDAPLHTLIFGTPAFVYTAVAGGLISYASYGIGAFIFVYVTRTFPNDPLFHGNAVKLGLTLGFIGAIGGWLGTMAGGIFGDMLRKRNPAGRLWLALVAVAGSMPLGFMAFVTHDITTMLLLYLLIVLIPTMWLGPCATSCQDMVLPRMRGAATAAFFLGTNLIGLAIGPYMVGLVSDVTGDLRMGMLSVYAGAPIVWWCLWRAIRLLPAAEASRIERARAAGEAI